MANTNTDPRYKSFLENFKKGLYAEAGNRYDAVNDSIPSKDRQAIGRYQFVPKYHWSEIKKTAKDNGFEEPKSYDDFKNNADLQDVYFETYVKKQVWPKVKAKADSNSLKDLSMDEYAYYLHFDPKSADNYLSTGNHREKTKHNPSGKTVIDRYRKARTNQGGNPVYGYNDETIKKEYDGFQKGLDEINKNPNGFSEEILANKRNQLQKDYQRKGLIEPFNKIIEQENQVKIKSQEELLGLLNKPMNIEYNTVKGADGKEVQKLTRRKSAEHIVRSSANNNSSYAGIDLTKEQYEYYNKKYPGILTNKKGNFIDGAYAINVSRLNKEYNTLTQDKDGVGQNLFTADANGNLYRNSNQSISLNTMDAIKGNISPDLANKTGYKGTLTTDIAPFRERDFRKPLLEKFPDDYVEEETTTETDGDGNGGGGVSDNNPIDPTTATGKDLKVGDPKAEGFEEGNTNYFDQEMNVPQVEGDGKFKDTFPYADVLGNAAGAMIGMNMAKKPIPMRDEQVSDAYRNYAAELSKLSKMGLRPEEEGYAKRMLTESYQGSVDAMVQASGGNRNLVLGNMGRIDSQKQSGMMEIALADASAKTAALHKYGEAMKYINEFDATRDIENNERKYKDALMTKEAGGKLASASFSAMLDSVDEHKRNAPGSANHAYKSYMYKKTLGFDPQLQDDGTGDTPNTYSWYKNQQQKLANDGETFNIYRNKYGELSPENKKNATLFIEQNMNKEQIFKFIDHMADKNPQGAIDMNNYQQAMKSNDMGVLFSQEQQMNSQEGGVNPIEQADIKLEGGTYNDILSASKQPQPLSNIPSDVGPQNEKTVQSGDILKTSMNVQSPNPSITNLSMPKEKGKELSQYESILDKKKNNVPLTEYEEIFEETYSGFKGAIEGI